MEDLRSRARVPFGYKIVDGRAEIDPIESSQLKKYFSLYLGGTTMAEAAHEARLQCSATTFRNLLKRKEYSGTDYYPAIITPEYQDRLVTEWERRRGEVQRGRRNYIRKGVRIYTDFRMKKNLTESSNLIEQINELYQRIRPIYQTPACK